MDCKAVADAVVGIEAAARKVAEAAVVDRAVGIEAAAHTAVVEVALVVAVAQAALVGQAALAAQAVFAAQVALVVPLPLVGVGLLVVHWAVHLASAHHFHAAAGRLLCLVCALVVGFVADPCWFPLFLDNALSLLYIVYSTSTGKARAYFYLYRP